MIRERTARLTFSLACFVAIAAILGCHPKTEAPAPDASAPPAHKVGNFILPEPDFELGQGDRR